MQPQASLSTYRDLLIKYLRPQWLRATFMSILLLTSIALQILNPQIVRYFIDAALAGQENTVLLLYGALFIGISLLNQLLSILTTYLSTYVAWTATNRLRGDLVAHCLSLDMNFHKARTSGELIERIDGDVNALSNFFSQALLLVGSNTLLIVGIIVVLFLEDWRIGLVIGTFALLALLLMLRIRNRATASWNAERELSTEFFGFVGEQLEGTADIRSNGATNYVMHRFYNLLHHWFPINRRASMNGYRMFISTLVLFGLGNACAFAIGAYLWSTGTISIGIVYLVFYYTNLLQEPLEQIRRQLEDFQRAGASIQRVANLFQQQSTIIDGSGAPLPAGPLSVDFEHVTFGYDADAPILQGLNFHLPPGHLLGVLGRTGSGKTTLARLLLRLYDVQAGSIALGNIPIQSPRLRDLRTRIGMVTQDVQLFHGTVRDNLTFFDHSIPDTRILEVLQDLGLDIWYRSLSDGLDTELSSGGSGLSAGEAQLLAFTRIFLKDPGLVIMDEASSRLDPATEQLIERAVSKLLANRTGIIIAHRLSTLQRVNSVLILEDGHSIEYGHRTTLANQPNSRFAQLLKTGLEEAHA